MAVTSERSAVPAIAEAEYKERVARIQEAMGEQGFDALVLFSDPIRSSSVRYVVDFWPIDGFLASGPKNGFLPAAR